MTSRSRPTGPVWPYTFFWALAPWSLAALVAAACHRFTGALFILLPVWTAAVLLLLMPWRRDGRAALAVSSPGGAFPRLTGLEGNREPGLALGLAAFLLTGASVWGRGGPAHGPTMAGLWGLLAACTCLYLVLKTKAPGAHPALWQPAPAPVQPGSAGRETASDLVSALLDSETYRGQVVWHRRLPASESRLSTRIPLKDREGARDTDGPPVRGLYDNQARAWELLDEGHDVLVASPLGSGKSTLAALYAANHVLTTARNVLCVCPDEESTRRTGEAFARATRREEWDWAVQARVLPTPADAEDYLDDGTMPLPDVAVVSAECLHSCILQRLERWEPLLKNVDLVVIEDIHLYDLVPRQHAAYVFRRLWRALERLGRRPRALVTSADMPDARRFARDLTGLDIKAGAVITSDSRARPAVEVLYWQPVAPDGPPDEGRPDQAAPRPSVPSVVREACSLMARALLHGFNVALLTDEGLLSPALARTAEADAYRMARQAAQSAYRLARQRLAHDIRDEALAFIDGVNAALAEVLSALEAQTGPEQAASGRRLAEQMSRALISAGETVLSLAQGRVARDRADAERDIQAFEELKRRLDPAFAGPSGWRERFEGVEAPAALAPLLKMKEKLDGLLSSTAVAGLIEALRVYSERMARLDAARVEVCSTLERSGRAYGSAPSAAEAFDAVIIMGVPDPLVVFSHQLAHIGQARKDAPNDALVVVLPSVEPVSRRLAHHPEELLDVASDEPVPAAPLGLANPGVVRAHLECALAESPMSEAEVREVFGDPGVLALDELLSAGLVVKTSVPLEDAEPEELQSGAEAAGGTARMTLYSWSDPDTPPHGAVSFSVTDGPGIPLRDPVRPRRELARLSEVDVTLRAYPGAVLSAGGERYRVKEESGLTLRLEGRQWVTEPRLEVGVGPPRTQAWVMRLAPGHPVEIAQDHGQVTVRTTGFVEFEGPEMCRVRRRVDLASPSPEASVFTDLLYLHFPVEELGPETLDTLARVLERSLPCVVQKAAVLRATAGEAGCVIWDACPGGSGAVPAAVEGVLRLLEVAFEGLVDCRCRDGCPWCVGIRGDADGPGSSVDKRELILLLGRVLGREDEAREVAAVRYAALREAQRPDACARRLAREVADVLQGRLGMRLSVIPEVQVEGTDGSEGCGEAGAGPDGAQTSAESPGADARGRVVVPGDFTEGDTMVFLAHELALHWTTQPTCFSPELGETFRLSQGFALWVADKVREVLRLQPEWRPEVTSEAERGLAACRALEARFGLRAFVRGLAAPGEEVRGCLKDHVETRPP